MIGIYGIVWVVNPEFERFGKWVRTKPWSLVLRIDYNKGKIYLILLEQPCWP
jgi:hypothetical protein